jgi:SP family myo-inositol transporter-like MFS transporter 13
VFSASPDISQVESVDLSRSLDSIEDTDSGYFVWLVSLAASIAGLLFGYDTGIISGVLVQLGTSLDHRIMTPSEKEAITSLCSGGAFFGAIAAGLTADKFGRKASIYFGCVLFTIGAVLQATSYSFAQMCVGRLIVGLGVGSAAM